MFIILPILIDLIYAYIFKKKLKNIWCFLNAPKRVSDWFVFWGHKFFDQGHPKQQFDICLHGKMCNGCIGGGLYVKKYWKYHMAKPTFSNRIKRPPYYFFHIKTIKKYFWYIYQCFKAITGVRCSLFHLFWYIWKMLIFSKKLWKI